MKKVPGRSGIDGYSSLNECTLKVTFYAHVCYLCERKLKEIYSPMKKKTNQSFFVERTDFEQRAETYLGNTSINYISEWS